MQDVKAIKNHIAFDANKVSKDIGATRSMNMVMLGAASAYLDIPYEKLENGIRTIFGRKGEEIVQANLKAMKAGRYAAEECLS